MPQRPFLKLGEALTKALVTDDFGLYRQTLTLPVRFAGDGGKSYELADEAALKADFDLYVSVIRLYGVTDIYRQLRRLDPAGPDAKYVHWTTHILVRANLLTEPFPTRMLMRNGPDGWQIAEITSSEGHLNWTLGRAKLSPQGRFETEE